VKVAYTLGSGPSPILRPRVGPGEPLCPAGASYPMSLVELLPFGTIRYVVGFVSGAAVIP
jgi:hypothetical protein